MGVFEKIYEDNFEQIVFCHDSRVGLKAIISMHNTALGPATGGCRMWDYQNEAEALTDVLRLSRGMTYKAAISNLSMGGGKSVIIGSQEQKTPELFKRFGEFIENLAGRYVTAKDVGINSDDLRMVKQSTQYVLGIDGEKNSGGDPSSVTAWGVFHGMRASVEHAFGSTSFKGLTVALQGLGAVNYHLAKYLDKEGAILVGCDLTSEATERAHKDFNVRIVEPEKIFDAKCDVFSPGALGGSVNQKTIPRLQCKVIAGAANNQMGTSNDGSALFERGLIYAPDYTINAGGLINVFHEREGYDRGRALEHTEGIYNTIKDILTRSKAEKIPTHIIADRMAMERVRNAAKSI